MSIPLISAFISAAGLLLGSIIGAWCSWYINKLSLKEQIKLKDQDFYYQEKYKLKEKYINVSIIRLDFCTAIYQSIRYLQNTENLLDYYIIPNYSDYHKVVASLSEEYSLKELSYIYQFYAILDNAHNSISKINRSNESYIYIRSIFLSILKKIYGNNYLKILNKNIDDISFEELYSDPLMKKGYRDLLKSLDLKYKKK